MRRLKEQTANSVGAEAGSEPTVPDNKFRFSFDSPYDILALDTARHIGTFLKVDYDKIKIEDFYEGMQIESKKFKNKPKTIGDWVVVAKIAFKNLYKNSSYYDTANESLRLSIRKIIKDLLKESKGSKMKKSELRKIIREEISNILLEDGKNYKVYLKSGEKAPKGAKTSKGPKGGSYYYTKSASVKTFKKSNKLTEASVELWNGDYAEITNSELNDYIRNPSKSYSSDNLVGWLYRALVWNVKARGRLKKHAAIENIIDSILKDIKSGKIKRIAFNRSSNGMLTGIKGLKI